MTVQGHALKPANDCVIYVKQEIETPKMHIYVLRTWIL